MKIVSLLGFGIFMAAFSAEALPSRPLADCRVAVYEASPWTLGRFSITGSRLSGAAASAQLAKLAKVHPAEAQADSLGQERFVEVKLTTEKERVPDSSCPGATVAKLTELCTSGLAGEDPVCESFCSFRWDGPECRP